MHKIIANLMATEVRSTAEEISWKLKSEGIWADYIAETMLQPFVKVLAVANAALARRDAAAAFARFANGERTGRAKEHQLLLALLALAEAELSAALAELDGEA